MASKNTNLTAARRAKNDEFYTQLPDIEKELWHYRAHFKDKVVYCNCDDPKVSNFYRYFRMNFEVLGLHTLLTTCYQNQNPDFFSQHQAKQAVWIEFTRQHQRCYPRKLKGDGDFRSEESIALLKKADIVVTNPPFSLFREYIAQLIEYDKKFVVIGNTGAIGTKDLFPFIKDGKVWLGASIKSGDREFGVPDHYPLEAASCRVDEKGNKFIRVKGVRWYTNLEYDKRHEDLPLGKTYAGNEKEYPQFDNYDAINVDRTKDIPCDYPGVMGVPVTFMDKHNPDQFEIIGLLAGNIRGLAGIVSSTGKDGPYMNGKLKYTRILIRNRRL